MWTRWLLPPGTFSLLLLPQVAPQHNLTRETVLQEVQDFFDAAQITDMFLMRRSGVEEQGAVSILLLLSLLLFMLMLFLLLLLPQVRKSLLNVRYPRPKLWDHKAGLQDIDITNPRE